MSRTIVCPNCHATQPVEETQDEHPRVGWCQSCQHPFRLGSEAAGGPRQVRILWIDDDRLLLTFGKEALERLGYRVLTASDGVSGIDTAKQEEPDLIILDVLMPNMDGYETCRRLRADAGLKDTPVLLLTALEERMLDLWGREAGATFTMSKPSRPEHIASIIAWMLSCKLGPPPV